MIMTPREDPLFFEDPSVHAFALGLFRDTAGKRSIRIAGLIVRVTSLLVCGILAIAAITAWTGDAPAWALAFVGVLGLAAGLGVWFSRMTTAVLQLMALTEATLELAMVQVGLRELPDPLTRKDGDA
jgi:hypothetical protein